MTIQVAQLIFNDTPSRNNKDLTDFLKRHIRNIIVKGQIRFQFKIAQSTDLGKLRQRNINALPAMIIRGGGRPVIGVPNIVQTLSNLVKRSRNRAAPKSEEEVLNDYMMQEMGKGVKKNSDGHFQVDTNDDDWDNPDINAKFQKELDRRKRGGYGAGSDMESKRQSRKPPPKPTHSLTLDDDFEDRQPVVTARPRKNNLEAGDPMASLQNIAPSRDRRDDDMMRALLERMGTDDDHGI